MPQAITKSSTAQYFAKNLQQVGFSSATKAVLTTLKEAVDNALDACEEAGIPPDIKIYIQKKGQGSSRNTDLISVIVEDNGPGISVQDIPKVFGEYLASSKFGRGRCSRGQQGIGISAATTWAQLTNARGVRVISKTKSMSKGLSVTVGMDIKNNRGILKDKKDVPFKPHGLRVEFYIDGRVQLNGEGGLITYLEGTTLVNPHLQLEYKLLDGELRKIPRVSDKVPKIPPATLPHPHTMKLGEFLHHASLYGRMNFRKFLKQGFSKITDSLISEMRKEGLSSALFNKAMTSITEKEYKHIFQVLQKIPITHPTTQSVLIVGEEALASSIHRLGEVDFFSVVTRKPRICDSKCVVVEVAIARLQKKRKDEDSLIQLLRFANRVPLQFDKSSCAITKAAESVNWRTYGLPQSKNHLPQGPYVFAISVTSPFIKFKNASKETIDASDELVEEIRLALMQAGQKLKRHIRKEMRTEDLMRKKEYIEKFAPILIKKLGDITKANKKQMQAAKKGLYKILSRDALAAEKALSEAEIKLQEMKGKIDQKRLSLMASTSEKPQEVSVTEGGKEHATQEGKHQSVKKAKTAKPKKGKKKVQKAKTAKPKKGKKKVQKAKIAKSKKGKRKVQKAKIAKSKKGKRKVQKITRKKKHSKKKVQKAKIAKSKKGKRKVQKITRKKKHGKKKVQKAKIAKSKKGKRKVQKITRKKKHGKKKK